MKLLALSLWDSVGPSRKSRLFPSNTTIIKSKQKKCYLVSVYLFSHSVNQKNIYLYIYLSIRLAISCHWTGKIGLRITKEKPHTNTFIFQLPLTFLKPLPFDPNSFDSTGHHTDSGDVSRQYQQNSFHTIVPLNSSY